ncbi:MAG: hypothetical protein M1385_01695 [Candidatus Marsarchaeota archaeon]|nr:hypothetical protein [Candidatus Marsarchaeota archaeon]
MYKLRFPEGIDTQKIRSTEMYQFYFKKFGWEFSEYLIDKHLFSSFSHDVANSIAICNIISEQLDARLLKDLVINSSTKILSYNPINLSENIKNLYEYFGQKCSQKVILSENGSILNVDYENAKAVLSFLETHLSIWQMRRILLRSYGRIIGWDAECIEKSYNLLSLNIGDKLTNNVIIKSRGIVLIMHKDLSVMDKFNTPFLRRE